MDHIIRIEYSVGKALPEEPKNDHLKYVMGLVIEKLIMDAAFSDLTETAVKDVLIKRLSDWNYKSKTR